LIARRNTAQSAYDEAVAEKTSLEGQILTLEELKYTTTNADTLD
jgi:hypothetical protein